jgi:hypothetical protein
MDILVPDPAITEKAVRSVIVYLIARRPETA